MSNPDPSKNSSKLGTGILIGVGISAVAALTGVAIWQRDKLKDFATDQKSKWAARKAACGNKSSCCDQSNCCDKSAHLSEASKSTDDDIEDFDED